MAALTGDHDGRLGFHIDRENNHRETKAKKLHVSKLRKESASTTVVIREKVGPPSGRENDITSTNKVSKPSEELGSNMLKETDENDKRREAYGLPKPSKKSGSVMVAKNVRSNGKIRSHEEFGKNVKPNQVLKPSKEPNSTTWSEINGTVAKNGFNNDSPLMVLKPSEELGTKMMKESDEINERMGAYGCQTILEGRKKRKYGMKTNEANERISARSENGYDDHDIKPIELPKPSAEKSGSIMVARTVEKNVKPIEVLKPLEKSDVIDVTATGESNKRIMSRNKSVKAISQKIKKPSKEFGPIAVKKTIPPKRAQESTDSEQQRKRLNSAVAQELEKRKLKGKIRQYQEEKLKVQAELSEMKTKYEKSETDKHNLFTQTQMQVEKLREWEEVSIDIEETSEEVEETAYMIKQEFDELSSNLPDEIGQRLGYVQNLIAHLNENIDHLTRRREGLADAREL